MSRKNKVIWSEGLFLKPTHFQQHDRYVEGFVEKRCRLLSSFSWGFDELNIDVDLLNQGKLSIKSARGVLPDVDPMHLLYTLSGALIYLVNVAPIIEGVTGRAPAEDAFIEQYIATLMQILSGGLAS